MVMDAYGEVMSKSKGNVVSPIDVMNQRGVDITRLAMYFTAPSEKEVMWSDQTIAGVERFVVNRMSRIVEDLRDSGPDLNQRFNPADLSETDRELYVKLNRTIKKAGEDSDRLQFNTVIAGLMELLRDFRSDSVANDQLNDRVILNSIQIIAPLAPHLAEELWEQAGFNESVFRSRWPEFDPDAIVGEQIEVAVQVNGKLRGTVSVPPDADQETVEEAAFGDPKVKAHTDGKEIVKKIFVKGRILNIVAKG
jgi:leucyl-tRNA synthetase